MLRSLCLFALGCALSACSNAQKGPGSIQTPAAAPYAPSSSDASRSAAPSAAAGVEARSAAPGAPNAAEAAPPSARDSSSRSYEAAPARPGLGTEWGETRSSRVSSVAFQRDDSATPAAVTSLYYNDAEGLRAMTRGSALSSFVSPGASVRGALTVRLLDASGSALPSYDFGARTYVLGSHGDRYTIEITNHTGQRFEAVTTVDGLDVMDGRPGSFDKRGYLVGPWATLEIDGFRRSFDEVAAFRFGSVASSYAAKKGDDRNVGVIGVAFFSERGAPSAVLEREAERRYDANPFPGRFAEPPR